MDLQPGMLITFRRSRGYAKYEGVIRDIGPNSLTVKGRSGFHTIRPEQVISARKETTDGA